MRLSCLRVGEVEMMADLVHQDVGDERAERLLVGP